jgi:hypothetical protein
MRSQFRLPHLSWILLVAAVAVACGTSTAKSPTAATTTNTSPGSATGPDSGPTPGTGSTGSSGTGSTGSSGIGTLIVTIKDSPFSEATALLVTFSEVSVHLSGTAGTAGTGTSDGDGEWMKLPFADGATTRTCDLTKLVDKTDVLGVGNQLKADSRYTQIRLTVSSATIYKTFATESKSDPCVADPNVSWSLASSSDKGISVDVPSGTLKLNREFTVPAGGATTITLDFDGDKSVHQTGNGKYKMTPVISVVSVQ